MFLSEFLDDIWSESSDGSTQKTLNTKDPGWSDPALRPIWLKNSSHKHTFYIGSALWRRTQLWTNKTKHCIFPSLDSCIFKNLFFTDSIDITPDGMKAIVTLSTGDMRRSLNILQVCIIWKSDVLWFAYCIAAVMKNIEKNLYLVFSCTEYSYGLWEGDGGDCVHMYWTSSQIRHRQHTGLGPQ